MRMSVVILRNENNATSKLDKNFGFNIPQRVYLNEQDLLEDRQKCWYLIKEYARDLGIEIYSNPFKSFDCDAEELFDEEMVQQVEDCILGLFTSRGAKIVNVGAKKMEINNESGRRYRRRPLSYNLADEECAVATISSATDDKTAIY